MKTLLVATDLSESSLQIANYAYKLAQTLRANLLLCNAINVPAEVPQNGTVVWPQSVYDDMERDSCAELLKIKERLIADSKPDSFQPLIECIHDSGIVTDVVNAQANRQKVDLLIIGAHGNNGLGTWLIGNHTRKFIETAVCPLLIIPRGVEFKSIKKIGFGSDFKHPELDIQAIDQLIKLSRAWRAELVLTHVQTDNQSVQNNSVIKNLLADLMRDHGHQQVSVKVIKSQQVKNGLEWLVGHEHIDLLVVVHQRHSFFNELFHGSQSKEVAAQLGVPLLVFDTH